MIIAEDRSSGTSITIALTASEDGGINLSGQDVGEAPKRAFGSSDYEYGLAIPPEGLSKLVIALLAERYAGQLRAVSQLRAFCETNEIPHSFWNYP